MIWLIGRGMLGKQIEKTFEKNQIDYISTDIEVDITDIGQLKSFSENKKIDWIINCSAYTAVDKAESDEEKARAINATGVKNIAQTARELDVPLIHFSTDYVFDGKGNTPINEDKPTCPASVYGRTKLEGENLLKETCNKYFIIRISWLYGIEGPNFVKTMIRLMKEKESLNVVGDQMGSPTYAGTLSENIAKLVSGNTCGDKNYGIYHYSDEGNISWYDFAEQIQKEGIESGLLDKNISIHSITTDQYPTPANRPAYSTMDKTKIKSNLNFTVNPWKENLKSYFKEWKDSNYIV